MIINEHIAAYLDSLATTLPESLEQLEQDALIHEVPIIRKSAQELLSFLLILKKPKKVLEVGTAVGFSCLLMNEFLSLDSEIVTIEKVPMRIKPAKENLDKATNNQRITLFVGEAMEALKLLCKQSGSIKEIYIPKTKTSIFPNQKEFLEELPRFQKQYDFIFMDAAKGQYMNFLPYILELLSDDGILVTDNVLQEGSIADSKFSIPRRERTIHMRMREYLFTLTHSKDLKTVVLAVGDGMTLTVKQSL